MALADPRGRPCEDALQKNDRSSRFEDCLQELLVRCTQTERLHPEVGDALDQQTALVWIMHLMVLRLVVHPKVVPQQRLQR